MSEFTIVSPIEVTLWIESAMRYPLAGSDLKERFLKLAASHEQLRQGIERREVEIQRLIDAVAEQKAALKAKGGRKR
jgi:two-component sensor histidine kinase